MPSLLVSIPRIFVEVVLKNEHGTVEFLFKFYVTVEGGMDFRAMLMKRKVKQKKVVVKKIEWLEVNNKNIFSSRS